MEMETIGKTAGNSTDLSSSTNQPCFKFVRLMTLIFSVANMIAIVIRELVYWMSIHNDLEDQFDGLRGSGASSEELNSFRYHFLVKRGLWLSMACFAVQIFCSVIEIGIGVFLFSTLTHVVGKVDDIRRKSIIWMGISTALLALFAICQFVTQKWVFGSFTLVIRAALIIIVFRYVYYESRSRNTVCTVEASS